MKKKGLAPVQIHSEDTSITHVDSIQSVDKAVFFVLTPLFLLIAIYLVIKNQCKREEKIKCELLKIYVALC